MYLPPGMPVGGTPCFLTVLRAELWDPGIKTLATPGALFALALPFVAVAYGAAEESNQTAKV